MIGSLSCLARLCAASLFLFVFSCSSDNPYLYDKPGFDRGTNPVVMPNPNAPVRVAPDYYYRQPYPANNYYQQGYRQPYGQYPNQYPPPYGSSSYSNPYAFSPQGNYPSYDADQYYIPPSYYGNSDYYSQGAPNPNAGGGQF